MRFSIRGLCSNERVPSWLREFHKSKMQDLEPEENVKQSS